MSKILVVEDSPDISRLVRHILTQAGHQVLAAENGAAGWDIFQQEQPDLVLLDINLPGLNGLEICRRIKEIASTPVIILTVRAESESVSRGMLVGADYYLTKPFEIDELTTTVKRALRPQIRRLTKKQGDSSGT